MLVSQFELLLNKSQFPKPGDITVPGLPTDELAELSREVLQGYFLNISNLSDKAVHLFISFQVLIDPGESPFDANNVVAVFDIDGNNQIVSLIEPTSYVINVPAKDTGLLIVQPNPTLIVDPKKEVEIKGYVDISVISHNCKEEVELLLSPQHRGTFYKRKDKTFDTLDQIAYGLPTPNGGSLFKLSPCISH